MRIETDRLILRLSEVRDVEDYMAFCNSGFVLRYNAMTPRTKEQMLRQFSAPSEDMLVIEHKKDGKVIGEISIEDDSVRWGVKSKELSYFISEDYSRQGYMKEALRELIGYLFEKEDIECVAARCFAPNIASLALLKSLGFHQDGYIPHCVKGYKDQIFDDTLHSLFKKESR